jgi:hypothetical protein
MLGVEIRDQSLKFQSLSTKTLFEHFSRSFDRPTAIVDAPDRGFEGDQSRSKLIELSHCRVLRGGREC